MHLSTHASGSGGFHGFLRLGLAAILSFELTPPRSCIMPAPCFVLCLESRVLNSHQWEFIDSWQMKAPYRVSTAAERGNLTLTQWLGESAVILFLFSLFFNV